MKQTLTIAILLTISATLFSQGWIETNPPGTTQLNSISAPDANNVWACGNNGIILRTTNGGTNWTSVTAAPIPNTLPLYCIFGIDANTALVTGSSATATFVYRTSNAGALWTQVFTQAGGFIDAVAMGNAVAGFMVGDPVGGRWSLWGTVTGGLTWDSTQFYLPQAGTETGYNNSFVFDAISQVVWFGTGNTRIYRSSNLILWSNLPTTPEANSYALWFNGSVNGMMGGAVMLRTTNAGANWAPTAGSLPGTTNILGINGMGANWYVIRQAPQIYYSFNDGATWAIQYTAPAGGYTHLTQSRTGGPMFYACRDNGGISKGGLPVGIPPVSSITPDKFSLGQNYPNPFNPVTKINFDIPKSGAGSVPVRLSVYDETGRLVTELVNESLAYGTYEVAFDASQVSSGVYYYTLQAGSFKESKKMSVVK